MKTLTRDRFVGHFRYAIQFHCLPMWRKRQKEAPTFLSASIFESMRTCAGEIPLELHAFARIVAPAIVELHRITPKGLKPDPADFTGRLYDALDAAGVEVGIGPPLEAHGAPGDSRRTGR